jgi:hypothetical protein
MPKRRKKRQSRVNPGLRDYATAGLRGIAERGKRAADAVERAAAKYEEERKRAQISVEDALRKLASDHGYDLVKR